MKGIANTTIEEGAVVQKYSAAVTVVLLPQVLSYLYRSQLLTSSLPVQVQDR